MKPLQNHRLRRVFHVPGWLLALLILLVLPTLSAQAEPLTTLHAFSGTSDGKFPRGQLVKDANGNFYGTTTQGGTYGLGTVFKIAPDGTFTAVHSFGGRARGDGDGPVGLITGLDGNFYGSTGGGGNCGSSGPYGGGCGTIFRLTPTGVVTIVYQLQDKDGAVPSPLALGKDGQFYGTTGLGGSSNQGTVFKFSTRGRFTSLHSFAPGEGTLAQGLIGGPDGYLFGVTDSDNGPCSSGTVYKISPRGQFKQLVCNTELQFPLGQLALGTDGNLYGVSWQGGLRDTGSCNYTGGCGTIFKVTPTGRITTLYEFTGGADGSSPTQGLVLGSDGNFYGSTDIGANDGTTKDYNGTLFRFNPNGQLSTIHVFDGTDGRTPSSPLLDVGDGSVLGTTFYGGSQDLGTVFKLEGTVGSF